MGLSQLHQLRGRVGRSGRRAYAYFTYRQGKEISEIATKRLSAIREYAEFGAGFRIALRDLEIRGAGNLLGAEQHGHLDAVGYDMYIKLLNEAVLEEKGEKLPEHKECKIDIPLDAYLPDTYIYSSAGRMEMYKKIALIETEEDLEEIDVPSGVKVNEVMVDAGDNVKKGDLLATVDMATVMTSLSSLQDQMDELDKAINDAKGEEAGTQVTAGVSGRVKIIYAEPEMDVSLCMAEHGALAVHRETSISGSA